MSRLLYIDSTAGPGSDDRSPHALTSLIDDLQVIALSHPFGLRAIAAYAHRLALPLRAREKALATDQNGASTSEPVTKRGD